MDARNLPYGAAEIIALRKAGKRPADMVLLSLIGPLRGENNPVVIAKPERGYDWRFLAGLDVALVAKTATPGMASLVKAIKAVQPATLAIWFADQQDGLNLSLHGYRPNTKTGRRIGLRQRAAWAGLGSDKSAAECLAIIAAQTKRRAIEHGGRLDPELLEMAQRGLRRIFGQAWEAAA